MTAAELTLIDDHVLVDCPGGRSNAAPRRTGPDRQLVSSNPRRNVDGDHIGQGVCLLERTSERWHPADQVVTVDGRIGDVLVHAHLTLN